jgi:hypothetical protein
LLIVLINPPHVVFVVLVGLPPFSPVGEDFEGIMIDEGVTTGWIGSVRQKTSVETFVSVERERMILVLMLGIVLIIVLGIKPVLVNITVTVDKIAFTSTKIDVEVAGTKLVETWRIGTVVK